MSLQDQYTDLMNLMLVKRGENPSYVLKLLNDIQSASMFYQTINGDTGSMTAAESEDTMTIAGGTHIQTSISGDTLTIETSVAPLNYIGTHDASTGSYPTGIDEGDFYVTSVAGTIDSTYYNVSDWMIYNGSDWEKLEGQTVVENDSAPKLGGDLDLNGQLIKDTGGNTILDSDGSGNINALGTLSTNIVFSGAQTVDGIDISAIALDNMPTTPSGAVGFNSQNINGIGNITLTTKIDYGENATVEYNSTDSSLDFTVS